MRPVGCERCEGRVFCVQPQDIPQVLIDLDYREKNGYDRQQLTVVSEEIGEIEALTYIAAPNNPAWLGDASDDAIANHIRTAVGPSGTNKDYVLSLNEALIADDIHDAHIQAIAERLRD